MERESQQGWVWGLSKECHMYDLYDFLSWTEVVGMCSLKELLVIKEQVCSLEDSLEKPREAEWSIEETFRDVLEELYSAVMEKEDFDKSST